MEHLPNANQLALIQQLRPYTPDEATFGRIYADLHDLLEASAWLLNTFSRYQGKTLSASEIEQRNMHDVAVAQCDVIRAAVDGARVDRSFSHLVLHRLLTPRARRLILSH